MTLINKILLVLFFASALFVFSQNSPSVFAQAETQILEGVTTAGGTQPAGTPESRAQVIINNVVDILSILVGVACTIMIIVGGYRYVTSGGDSSKLTSAKNTILYAVIGIVIVAFAQVLVNFVLKASTGESGIGSNTNTPAPTPTPPRPF